jgi:hypothetical protein
MKSNWRNQSLALVGAVFCSALIFSVADYGQSAKAQTAAPGQDDLVAKVPRGCPRWARPLTINRNAKTPATPGPSLSSYLQKVTGGNKTKIRAYGQAGSDLQFGDSFDLGHCRLCAARLEFKLAKESGQWDNDGFHVYLEPDAVSSTLPTPIFSTGANLWSMFPNGMPVVQWGSGFRPISELNSYIFSSQLQIPMLSVYIQDDSKVLSSRLTLWTY